MCFCPDRLEVVICMEWCIRREMASQTKKQKSCFPLFLCFQDTSQTWCQQKAVGLCSLVIKNITWPHVINHGLRSRYSRLVFSPRQLVSNISWRRLSHRVHGLRCVRAFGYWKTSSLGRQILCIFWYNILQHNFHWHDLKMRKRRNSLKSSKKLQTTIVELFTSARSTVMTKTEPGCCVRRLG